MHHEAGVHVIERLRDGGGVAEVEAEEGRSGAREAGADDGVGGVAEGGGDLAAEEAGCACYEGGAGGGHGVGGLEEEVMSWGREGREGLRCEGARVTDEALDDVTTYRDLEVRRD